MLPVVDAEGLRDERSHDPEDQEDRDEDHDQQPEGPHTALPGGLPPVRVVLSSGRCPGGAARLKREIPSA